MLARKLKKFIATVAFSSIVAFGADITGRWTASFDTAVGVQNYVFDFKMDGAKLTGSAKSRNGESAIQEGKVAGDSVAFVENMTFKGSELRIEYVGKVVSPSEIR